MSKRLFQILDEINLADSENGTANLKVGGSVIAAEEVKEGCKVTMGVESGTTTKLMNEEVMAVILIIDRETYKKARNGN